MVLMEHVIMGYFPFYLKLIRINTKTNEKCAIKMICKQKYLINNADNIK